MLQCLSVNELEPAYCHAVYSKLNETCELAGQLHRTAVTLPGEEMWRHIQFYDGANLS
jgi:hypothetical protein